MAAPELVFSANAFNWTEQVIAADISATDVILRAAQTVSSVLELEPGQLWPTFPSPTDTDLDAFRAELDAVGARVSIVGASIDEWSSTTTRRTTDQRMGFLLPQLRAAHRLGARGIRLPLGQAGAVLHELLLPHLHDLDLILFEEIQGAQRPDVPNVAAALDAIANAEDPRIRLLIDTSMTMPALPVTYLERLRRVGVPSDLVRHVDRNWLDPSVLEPVRELLRSGTLPAHVRPLCLNMLTRFGRSTVADLVSLLPIVGAFHVKFWDLEDESKRVSQPVIELGALVSGNSFSGWLCSEWGGFEWMDDADADDVTRRHQQLVKMAVLSSI
ncbi:restriction endonuclease subunit R [Microbacterium sp. 22215]|uniref:restriction endonuclease subunit R n=1 Tax=Microbacterium sp. 22215 TaxID=3453893 RepID=UPI003F87C41D